VTFFTNTPGLVQIYFYFYAMPEFGVVLTSYQAVLLGLTLNAGAYITLIQRGGFLSVRQNELDAAATLGMSLMQSCDTSSSRTSPGSFMRRCPASSS
jgi:polar amino acid transport system permease protein